MNASFLASVLQLSIYQKPICRMLYDEKQMTVSVSFFDCCRGKLSAKVKKDHSNTHHHENQNCPADAMPCTFSECMQSVKNTYH